MRRVLIIVTRLFLILLLLCTLAGAGGYVYMRRSLPQHSGVINVPGLQGPVEIIRDTDAVPHIYAASKRDAVFGLGYVHAQDRIWQMEFQRRLGQGRLAEILGEPTVGVDRFFRTLGTYRAARSAWEHVPAEDKTIIDAYVGGINAFLNTHRSSGSLPPEFTLLGLTPEPWSGPDVLVWLKVMSFNLGGNIWAEINRSDVIQAVGYERAQELMPYQPEDGLDIVPTQDSGGDYRRLIALGASVQSMLGASLLKGGAIGSNGWVVDGTKSTTGKPLLANDPHLGAGTPGIWYVAHLSADGFDTIGATIPGLPGVIIGHNRFIAWGVTNLGADTQDLFRERLDPTGRMAEFDGQMEPMQIITETITVKDQPPIQHQVRITRHGPLISDALGANGGSPPDEQQPPLEPLALRWPSLDPADTTFSAFLRINEARNWQDFTQALRGYVAPAMSFIYADGVGNIGYYAAGYMPRRSGGDGTLPAEGWTGKNEWVGWVDFDDLPHTYDPPAHFVATANNRPVPADYPFFLGREWNPDYRARRITDLLRANQQLGSNDFAAIQGDTVSYQAQQLLPLLLALAEPQNDDERAALELLRAWNYDMRGDSAAAALYAVWQQQLLGAIAGDELGEERLLTYKGWFPFTSRFLNATLQDRSSRWCDNIQTAPTEDCAAIAQGTLAAALNVLNSRLGTDRSVWRWDQVHAAVFPHEPFDHVDLLRGIFTRTIPNGGDESTVNVGPFNDHFEQRAAAMYRQIIDLAHPDESRFILAVGQSGHVLSPHYDDYLSDWQALRYRPLRFTRSAVEQARMATLQLQP